MNSESAAGILGAIVAVVVLAAAFVFGPLGQSGGKPQKAPARIEQPAASQPVPAAPTAPRGPVVREVPNN